MTMTPTKDELKYSEYLNVIANTCLLFNSRREMGKHIDYNLEVNNASSMNAFRKKSTFCELESEVDNWYGDKLSLETLIHDYQETSQIFTEHFKRSYSIDLQEENQEKRVQIFKIINYLYASDQKSVAEEIKFLHPKKREILKAISEEDNSYCALFILLMLHILPTYNSKKGSADHTREEFNQLIKFLRQYSKQAPVGSIAQEAPILEGFENRVKANFCEESDITRIDLIHLTTLFLDVIQGYSSPDNTFLINQAVNKIYPELDGFWSDSEIPGTHFWRFEKLENGYYLHEYIQTEEHGQHLLSTTKKEAIFFGEEESHLYICHPSVLKRIIQNQDTKGMKEWNDCKFSCDTTLIFPSNPNGIITKIECAPYIRTGEALIPDVLYRIADDTKYEEMLNHQPLRNAFEEDDYLLQLSSYAITNDALLVAAGEEECKKMGLKEEACLVKIPKTLNESLARLTLSDSWGLCNFLKGELYFAVPDSMIYYPITTPEQRNHLGVEIIHHLPF